MPKRGRKHHKSGGTRRRLPSEYRDAEVFIDFANLALEIRRVDEVDEATRAVELSILYDKAAERFPHPRFPGASSIPLPGRPPEQGIGFADPTTLMSAAMAVRQALCLIIETSTQKTFRPGGERSITLDAGKATSPRIVVLADGTIGVPADLFRDGLLPAVANRKVRRLAICPICDLLFIRRRYNQTGCSRVHSHAVFMREHRPKTAKDYKDRCKQYEANRKTNQKKNEERAKLRANARGNRSKPNE